MKSLIALSLSTVLTLSTAQAEGLSQADVSAKKKDAELLHSILHTALQAESEGKRLGYRGMSHTYLAKQGAVFTVNVSLPGQARSFSRFFEFNGANVPAIAPPSPPSPPSGADRVFAFSQNGDVDSIRDIEIIVERAGEVTEEIIQDVHGLFGLENNRRVLDLRGDKRDVEFELRELAREQRDIEFALRTASAKDRQELEKELAELKVEQAALEQKASVLAEQQSQIEQEQARIKSEREAAKKQARQAFLAFFEAQVGDTLCRFGNGFKALAQNAHLSFVLPNVALTKNDVNTVYVFDFSNIEKCVKGKIDTQALLLTAQHYEY